MKQQSDFQLKSLSPSKAEWEETRRFITKNFLRGAIVILPMVIILILLKFAFNFIFGLIAPISAAISPDSTSPHWITDVLSVVILSSIILGIGMMVSHKSGRQYFKSFEKEYLNQIPLYGTIRETVQQFSGLKEMPFKQVVLVDIFGSGTLMTGFVTERISDTLFTIFVPTAPNPTNGNIYHVPVEKIKFLPVSSERAMRSVVGMGTGSKCLFFEDFPDSICEAKQKEVIEKLKEHDIVES